MTRIEYVLGTVADLDQLFPPAEFVNPEVGLRDRSDVIGHYTGAPTPAQPDDQRTI